MKHALLVAIALTALESHAADTWTTPFPGVRLLHRTGAGNLNVYLAIVDLCSAGVSLRTTAFAERGQRTSAIATSVGAQLAINGDFSCRAVDVAPGSPFPPCLGLPVYTTYGIAAHAGAPWPNTIALDALLAVGADRVQIYDDDEDQTLEPWMSEAVSGHWSIVKNGVLLPNDCPIDPRSAVGLSADRSSLLLGVADGRGSYRGMTCLEMAQLLVDHGADRAFALDSGGSSTMWLQGQGVVNHPSDGNERVVGNHIMVYATGAGRPASCVQPPPVVNVNVPVPAPPLLGAPARLITFPPRRLFDTRTPSSSTSLVGLTRDATTRVAAQSSFSSPGEPAATSLIFHLTADDAEAPGFVIAWPEGGTRPATSLLNQAPMSTVANTGFVAQSGAGNVSVFTSGATHLIGDAVGAFGPLGMSGYVPMTAARLLDTRSEPTLGLAGNVVRTIVPAGSPSTEALALNVTSVGSIGPGFISVFACGQPVPSTSTVNFAAGQVSAGFTVAKAGPSGVCAFSNVGTHVVVDRMGRFEPGGSSFQAMTPTRWVDTRTPGGAWSGRTARNAPLELRMQGSLPSGARAVALNVTVTAPLEDGFVTLYPCAQPAPTVSHLNYAFGQTVANAALVEVADGRLCLVSSGRTHVILDAIGAFVPPPDAGTIVDAGVPFDAGASLDAGAPPDSGTPSDAGREIDAGAWDSGAMVDAGPNDAGMAAVDAGGSVPDAGPVSRDAGTSPDPTMPMGCGCSSSTAASAVVLVALAPLRRRRRP